MSDESAPSRLADFAAYTPETLPWRRMCDGVDKATLLRDPARDFSVMLLRYRAGATAPRHVHPDGEQFYVVSGTVVDETGRYGAGTFVNHPPGSVHTPSSPDGALILVSWFGRLSAYVE